MGSKTWGQGGVVLYSRPGSGKGAVLCPQVRGSREIRDPKRRDQVREVVGGWVVGILRSRALKVRGLELRRWKSLDIPFKGRERAPKPFGKGSVATGR